MADQVPSPTSLKPNSPRGRRYSSIDLLVIIQSRFWVLDICRVRLVVAPATKTTASENNRGQWTSWKRSPLRGGSFTTAWKESSRNMKVLARLIFRYGIQSGLSIALTFSPQRDVTTHNVVWRGDECPLAEWHTPWPSPDFRFAGGYLRRPWGVALRTCRAGLSIIVSGAP